MKVKLEIDKRCEETEVTVRTRTMDDEVTQVMSYLTDRSRHRKTSIPGIRDERIVLLEPEEIYSIYSQGGKTFADTEEQTYEIKIKLYQAEEKLAKYDFIRIGKSEIINLKKVEYFEAGITGTIVIVFKNGKKTYVSRRFVKSLKERLGV